MATRLPNRAWGWQGTVQHPCPVAGHNRGGMQALTATANVVSGRSAGQQPRDAVCRGGEGWRGGGRALSIQPGQAVIRDVRSVTSIPLCFALGFQGSGADGELE